MKIKVSLLDKKLAKNFFSILSVISVIISLIFLFWDIRDDIKKVIGILTVVFLVLLYLILWIRANKMTKISLSIQNSELEVKVGNIFETKGLKVIAFNEYFDTTVDNKIISERSLNGIFIKDNISDIEKFDSLIKDDSHLFDLTNGINENRKFGKKQKYKLGSIFQYKKYLLTAFSRFDDDNRAYLGMNDYVRFLLNFWNEVDICYANRSVNIPLLGSGITRFKEYNSITDQELLEILIWTFKLSRIKFKYPTKATILIHESKKDKINFYELKGWN